MAAKSPDRFDIPENKLENTPLLEIISSAAKQINTFGLHWHSNTNSFYKIKTRLLLFYSVLSFVCLVHQGHWCLVVVHNQSLF
jgi:hypothetical protein